MIGTLRPITGLLALVPLGISAIGARPNPFLLPPIMLTQPDTGKPEFTLQVDSVLRYPAHPSDVPWTFLVSQGKFCTLAPAFICCHHACHVLNSTVGTHEEQTDISAGSPLTSGSDASCQPATASYP